VLRELLLEGADSAPASGIVCAKRSIPPPCAPHAQLLMQMAEGRVGDPEAAPAVRARSAAERPPEGPRLPGPTGRVPGQSTHLVSEVLPEPRRHPCPCSAGSGIFGFPVFELRRCCFSPWGCCFPKSNPQLMLGISLIFDRHAFSVKRF